MTWEQKVWGKTRCVYDSDVFSGHQLIVDQGGYCSVHYHQQRANRFIVESGKIGVVIYRAWDISVEILDAGERFDVPSLIVHQFLVYESGVVREDYWADRGGVVSKEDIVRLRVGAKVASLNELWRVPERILRSEVVCKPSP